MVAVVVGSVLGCVGSSSLAQARTAMYLPQFVQGQGVVFVQRPTVVDGTFNARPPAYSGIDTWTIKRWSSWGGARATAKASYFHNTKSGTGASYPARLVLSGHKTCGGKRYYTRIRGTFTGKRPAGFSKTISGRKYAPPC
jgi:hypothetical protein